MLAVTRMVLGMCVCVCGWNCDVIDLDLDIPQQTRSSLCVMVISLLFRNVHESTARFIPVNCYLVNSKVRWWVYIKLC